MKADPVEAGGAPGAAGPHRAGRPDPGLCGVCRHARVVRTRRGSRFYLCRRSETDERFVRYPPLPVLRCPGFQEVS